MTLREMMERQYAQQRKIMGPRPEGRAEQRQLAITFSQYINEEVQEYLDSISYKHFLPTDEAPRQTRILELIDIQKYLLCLMWLEGVDPAEMEHLFLDKTDVVYERHTKQVLGSKICGFDIDGVLAHLDFGANSSEESKEEFYENGGATSLEPIPGARDTLVALKAAGWGIVLVTARKLHRHARLEHETHRWLKDNGMPYDLLLWGYDKAEVIAKNDLKLRFFVDDHPKHAIDLARTGMTVYLLGSRDASHPLIKWIDSLEEIVELC